MSNSARNFPKNHDVILRYTKTDDFVFNPQKGAESEYRTRFQRFLTGNQVRYGSVKHKTDKLIHGRIKKIRKNLGRALEDGDILFDFDKEFKTQSDVIYASIIKGNSNERTGYPTQKPLALLEKLIKASSNEGDIVFDPFCGCATACVAAEYLMRNWVGCDISSTAGDLVKLRMQKELGLFYNGEIDDTPPKRTELDLTEDDNDLFADVAFIPYNHPRNKYFLFGNQNGICNGCGLEFDFPIFDVDHIVPRSKGGSNHISNLQLLCPPCNKSKGTMPMDEFTVKKKANLEAQLKHIG